MNKKLLIPVLAIAFVMLTTQVLASGATTWHFVGTMAFAMDLYNQELDVNMLIVFITGKEYAPTPKWGTFMLAVIYDSSFSQLWFALKDLGKGEFRWSMGQAMLSTTVDFLGVTTQLTARWDAITPIEHVRSNDFMKPYYHIVFSGIGRDASATATLDGLTFCYIPSLSSVHLDLNAEVIITKN